MNTRTLTVVVSAAALVALAGGCRRHAKRQAKAADNQVKAPANANANAEGFENEDGFVWENTQTASDTSSETQSDWSNGWESPDSFEENDADFAEARSENNSTNWDTAGEWNTNNSDNNEWAAQQSARGSANLFGFAFDFDTPVSKLTKAQVKHELETMVEVDQGIVKATAERQGQDDPAFNEVIRQIDQIQGARLAEIVDFYGWPTADMFGETAAQGAFAVVQHCGFNPEFQNHCLGLLVDQVNEGKVQPQYVALLTDRIRMFKGEPQLFGTQMKFEFDVDGIARPVPQVAIENPSELDNRRALMGMPPHAQFVAALEDAYAAVQPTASVETDNTTDF